MNVHIMINSAGLLFVECNLLFCFAHVNGCDCLQFSHGDRVSLFGFTCKLQCFPSNSGPIIRGNLSPVSQIMIHSQPGVKSLRVLNINHSVWLLLFFSTQKSIKAHYCGFASHLFFINWVQ